MAIQMMRGYGIPKEGGMDYAGLSALGAYGQALWFGDVQPPLQYVQNAVQVAKAPDHRTGVPALEGYAYGYNNLVAAPLHTNAGNLRPLVDQDARVSSMYTQVEEVAPRAFLRGYGAYGSPSPGGSTEPDPTYVELQPQNGGPAQYGVGSHGPAVEDLQLLLNQIYAQMAPGTSPLPINGYYDEATGQAVAAMHSSLKLPPLNYVDEAFATALWDYAGTISAYDINSPPPSFVMRGATPRSTPIEITGKPMPWGGIGIGALALLGLGAWLLFRKPSRSASYAGLSRRRVRRARRNRR